MGASVSWEYSISLSGLLGYIDMCTSLMFTDSYNSYDAKITFIYVCCMSIKYSLKDKYISYGNKL